MKVPKCPRCKTELILCSHGAWNCPNCFEFIRYTSPKEISFRDKTMNEIKKIKEYELKKAEEALGEEHNLNQVSFYEGYIKGLKFEPTKECKQPNLSTLLKEADKEFDDLWKHWIYLSEIKTGVNFNSFKNGIKSVFKYQITKAYKAGQEEGYDNGYKAKHFLVGEDSDLYEIARKDHDNYLKQQTIKQIEEWADKQNSTFDKDTAPHSCYRKGMEDLKKFLSKL